MPKAIELDKVVFIHMTPNTLISLLPTKYVIFYNSFELYSFMEIRTSVIGFIVTTIIYSNKARFDLMHVILPYI